ncbi:MAG: TerB family tellurite resistance protein [Alphaproteobacteria bacterium]
MSVWGKVLGGAAGFALGGPLGALVGAILGHAYDSRAGQTRAAPEASRQAAFTIAVIVLGAKMAKADGVVTRDEIAAFRKRFHVPPREVKQVGRLFNLAKRDARGFEPYARQIASLFRDEPAVMEELLDALFYIAEADGRVDPAELDFLRKVAEIFGLGHAFERLAAGHVSPESADPYAVLGVPRGADDAEIKAAHRRLAQENHPDRLIAHGMPKEFVAIATERMARINAAYDRIRAERGKTGPRPGARGRAKAGAAKSGTKAGAAKSGAKSKPGAT